MKIPLIAACLSLLLPIQSKALTLVDPKGGDFDSWMKKGSWQSKRDEPVGWTADETGLSMMSGGNSVLIGRELPSPLDIASTPRLRLKLRIDENPRGTDLRRRTGDDASFRIYLVFDKTHGLIPLPNTLAYAWTEREPKGALIPSAHAANMFYVSLGSGTTNGWVDATGDIDVDYRRAFPKETSTPRLRAVLLKSDSNDTRTSTRAKLGSAELEARGKRP